MKEYLISMSLIIGQKIVQVYNGNTVNEERLKEMIISVIRAQLMKLILPQGTDVQLEKVRKDVQRVVESDNNWKSQNNWVNYNRIYFKVMIPTNFVLPKIHNSDFEIIEVIQNVD